MVSFVRASALQGFVELAGFLGVDPLPLYEAVGIPVAVLSDPDARIRSDAVAALLGLAARRTGVDDLGLRLAQERRPSSWGAVGLLMQQQKTVGDALKAAAQYIAGHSDGARGEIETFEEEAVVWIDMDYGKDTSAFDRSQRTELALGSAVAIIRKLMRRKWQPLRVGFTHAARGNLERYRPFFGRIPLFDQDRNYFVIATTDLDAPIADHDPEAERITRLFAEQQLPATGPPFSRAVALTISQRLAEGGLSADAVAASLELDLRTLQRRLMAEGVSFSELLARVRMDLARTYVESSRRPLAEVADLLGFSSLSAFSQWYSKTHGVSAAERRAQADRIGQP
jgi:AraC-like DNA-binding protein